MPASPGSDDSLCDEGVVDEEDRLDHSQDILSASPCPSDTAISPLGMYTQHAPNEYVFLDFIFLSTKTMYCIVWNKLIVNGTEGSKIIKSCYPCSKTVKVHECPFLCKLYKII